MRSSHCVRFLDPSYVCWGFDALHTKQLRSDATQERWLTFARWLNVSTNELGDTSVAVNVSIGMQTMMTITRAATRCARSLDSFDETWSAPFKSVVCATTQ